MKYCTLTIKERHMQVPTLLTNGVYPVHSFLDVSTTNMMESSRVSILHDLIGSAHIDIAKDVGLVIYNLHLPFPPLESLDLLGCGNDKLAIHFQRENGKTWNLGQYQQGSVNLHTYYNYNK